MPDLGGKYNLPSKQAAELTEAQTALSTAEAELAVLEQDLQRFETRLDARLGPLLDQLSILDSDVQAFTAQVRDLRESRLFGEHRATYSSPGFQPLIDPVTPSEGLPTNQTIPAPRDPQVELRSLYHRLVRRFHPDLARTEAERADYTEQMMVINFAYSTSNLGKLRELAGEPALPDVPDRIRLDGSGAPPLTELERVHTRMHQVRQQIDRLKMLPIVQLSLEAKLARRQGRSLLTEMAADLQRKIARKTAERDYLRSQLEFARR